MKLTFSDNFDDFRGLMDELPKAVRTRVIISALKAGAEFIKIRAKAKVPKATGELGRSIKVRVVKSSRPSRGVVKVGVIGTEAPLAHIVEYGTAKIRSAKGKALRFKLGGKILYRRHVAAMPRKPFLRPAFDESQQSVIQIIQNQIGVRITAEYEKLARQKIKRDQKRLLR